MVKELIENFLLFKVAVYEIHGVIHHALVFSELLLTFETSRSLKRSQIRNLIEMAPHCCLQQSRVVNQIEFVDILCNSIFG